MVAKPLDPDKMFDVFNVVLSESVVPYTRMTQRGKFVKPDAIRYLDSQNRLKNALSVANHNREYYQMYHVPIKAEFEVDVTFYVHSIHHCDLDNLVKAIMDAGQKILYLDDRYCDYIQAKRVKIQPSEPEKTILIISPGGTHDALAK